MADGGLAWITGAGGLIGNYLVKTAPAKWKPRPLTRADFDLTDWNRLHTTFEKETPNLIIHCAAISKNPVCDANPDNARRVNIQVTINLLAAAWNIPFIFL